MNSAALIDYCLLEYGRATTDTVARAKVLSWLNDAEKSVCTKHDWWFLKDEVDFDFVNATAENECPPEWEEVMDLFWTAGGTPMVQMTERTYNAVFRPNSGTTGTPTHWAHQSRNATTQVMTIHVWPTPNADRTGAARVRLYPTTHSDSAASYSRIPEAHRMLLADLVRAEMKRDDGDLAKAQFYDAEAEKKMAALVADQTRRMGRH